MNIATKVLFGVVKFLLHILLVLIFGGFAFLIGCYLTASNKDFHDVISTGIRAIDSEFDDRTMKAYTCYNR